ncbi:MAG TPA: hypothetical protein VFG54_12310 [Prolixibacteraceae bacterium]|nr:hypothetical protein [Prolixibacteraceae bacterium]
MILHHNNRPIKLIPKKYLRIQNIADHLEDFDYIRLSDVERQSLDQELFRLEAENFLMFLSFSDQLAFETIKDAKPVSAGKIKDADGESCTILKMSNGISIRCDEKLASLSPIKFKPAKENVEQLTIF